MKAKVHRGKSEKWGSFLGFFLVKYSKDMNTYRCWHKCGHTCLHVCMCQGHLVGVYERMCVLNAWRAIPLILPSTHPSPPTSLSSLQPISFPISPSKWLHFMELWDSAGFAAVAAAFPWAMLQCCKLTLLFLPLCLFLFSHNLKCTKVIQFTLMIYSISYVGSFIICTPHADDILAPPWERNEEWDIM